LHITRHASPALAQQVRKGKLDAALVALPLNTEGFTCILCRIMSRLLRRYPRPGRKPPGPADVKRAQSSAAVLV
jgi:hypothetical protein